MHRSKRGLTTLAIVSVLSLLGCGTAWAQDDGARAYWKAMDGANIVAFQYLPFNGDSSDSIQNAYVTPLPEVKREGCDERDWDRVRSAVLSVYG